MKPINTFKTFRNVNVFNTSEYIVFVQKVLAYTLTVSLNNDANCDCYYLLSNQFKTLEIA